jgi:hypothetical protein
VRPDYCFDRMISSEAASTRLEQTVALGAERSCRRRKLRLVILARGYLWGRSRRLLVGGARLPEQAYRRLDTPHPLRLAERRYR